MALALAAGGMAGAAHAQHAFSSAWFANKGAMQNTATATGRLPNGMPASSLTSPQAQQQRANEHLSRSINNLNLAARGIAAQQAAQAAARLAAGNDPSVPDGLADGGLKVDTHSLTAGWINANAPVQSQVDGRTNVAIQQTGDKAILNWETFNVGRNTTVDFKQDPSWAVLNKVNDPQARPSQIQGQIKADGTVLIANRNGVVFSGTSQVNTRNLVAAAAKITDDQFRTKGIYVDANGSAPTFTDAAGKVEVQAGAQITTHTPQSATQGGGYVMLLGTEVRNAGQIHTPSGQTVLAAGDSFTIRKGVSTEGNQRSTTAGNEVSASRNADSASGTVINTGLITAPAGDITLTGHTVTQAGVLVATTTVAKRGTIHLSTRASDETGTVTVAEGSTTAILLDTNGATALDSQRDAALRFVDGQPVNNATGVFDNLGTIADRRDLSRIEIVSGSTVEFQGSSLSLATGGEIVVAAPKRALVAQGAQLDVSGAVGVKVAMENNNVLINAQGNEQRDAPINRDSKNLNNLNLWVDRRKLVFVPAGTNGYPTDRWYTEGGLLEVSGYLATNGHSIGEWMAQGGTVTVAGGDLVTRAGSSVNLSGGTLDVASGKLRLSWLKGSDGRLYEVSSAPGDLLYKGLYRGFEDEHARWGKNTTGYFYNPLIGPRERPENSYTVGRDAGRLVVATNNAVLEGTIVGETYQGPQQTRAAQADLDGYNQSQSAVVRRGQLIIGQYLPRYDPDSGLIRYRLTPVTHSIQLGESLPGVADAIALIDPTTADRQGIMLLDTDMLTASDLGAVRIAARKDITVESPLQVSNGGEIVLYAPSVDVAADLTAHGGTIRLGNVLKQSLDGSSKLVDVGIEIPEGVDAGVRVRGGVALDATGVLSDLRAKDGVPSGLAYIDGGLVSIRSTDSVTLEKGSLIGVSSGAAVKPDGRIQGGSGGSVQLGSGLASTGAGNGAAVLTIDGDIRGYGVEGGGTLEIESASAIAIGGKVVPVDGVLRAGDSALADLIVLNELEINVAAGGVLPAGYRHVVTIAKPGEVVGPTGIRLGVNIRVEADWLPPMKDDGVRYSLVVDGVTVVRSNLGLEISQGLGLPPLILDHVPAGAVVKFSESSTRLLESFVNYVVPANVFPNGLAIADRTVQLKSGDRAPFDVTVKLAAGSPLAAGTVLATDASVAGTTTLSTDLLRSGFSRYDVRAYNGLVVPDGVTLDVKMPVLRANGSVRPAGEGLDGLLRPWQPELYQDDPSTREVHQRGGASLSLSGGVGGGRIRGNAGGTDAQVGDPGNLYVGKDATLRVDPGQSIALSSRGDLTVEGTLQARGGSISLLGPLTELTDVTLAQGGIVADGRAGARRILVGERATLDASAEVHTGSDVQGQAFGRVTRGGSIVIGGELLESTSRATASDAFVVIREGAVIDASGAQAQLNVNGTGTITVASDGGSIRIASSSGLYLDGSLRAHAGGAGAAGGSLVVALEAPNWLNDGGFFGERSFQLKQGDLRIGNELKARQVNVSVDNGRLDVIGTIDASGEQVGSIRLAAARGLALAGSAVLDAHGTVLRVDSHGKIIDSPNRAMVELDAGSGTLVLGEGARIDLRHGTGSSGGDGRNRGTLDLYAPRIGSTGSTTDADAATFGDIAIDARGNVNIQGARSIAVYGKQRYSDAPFGTDEAASGRPYQVIDQVYLNGKGDEATLFVDGALRNGNLLNSKLAGLNNATYRDAFHLRPAIEIASATPDGDLVVRGDLDLSGLRYASLNPNTQRTSVYGSGEVGMLTLRAGGDLSIYGSINDGFAPPPETPDDGGWILTPGVQAFGGDVVVPVPGVTLAEGTVYPAGKTLNYAITVKDVTLPAGTVLPSAITLDRELMLPFGTVLAADVRAADGSVLLPAGRMVGTSGLALPAGAQLLAGARLPVAVTLARLTWPKGAKLPVAMTQSGSLVLPVGALIASGTNVALPDGALSVNLRPADSSGRQAQNWALAQMLPEGSQSWSLRLVAGADLQAADNRLTRLDAGSILLADTHYTVFKQTEIRRGGVWYWAPGNIYGGEPGTAAPDWADDPTYSICGEEAGQCVRVSWVWQEGNMYGGTPGVPVDDWADDPGYSICAEEPGQCVAVGGPAGEVVVAVTPKAPIFSVLRTGTGDLDLAAGGNFSMQSPYGVYTAGTQKSLGSATLDASYNLARGLQANGNAVLWNAAGDKITPAYEKLVDGTDSLYKAWYPDGGGNLRLDVGGDLTGDAWGASQELAMASGSVGNWLWRQGTGNTPGVSDVPTAWWINFGTYSNNERTGGDGKLLYWPAVTGFTGLGTLGGGDASIRVGGNAGAITTRSTMGANTNATARSQGVMLAVGSTGRVLADGSLALTGGGDLDLRVGGGWNGSIDGRLSGANGSGVAQTQELYGGLVNLRGGISMSAGRIGTVELFYGAVQDPKEIRASNPYEASIARATGGLMLMQGDAGASISSRGDLVLGGTGNPGLVPTPNGFAFTPEPKDGPSGKSWFSLWTDRTALDLSTAGGNLALDTRAGETAAKFAGTSWDYASNGGWYLLPGTVRAVAAMGSIYYGPSAATAIATGSADAARWNSGLLLAPLGERRIELLAGGSLYGGGYAISSSGADASATATIEHPGFTGFNGTGMRLASNVPDLAPSSDLRLFPLFAFDVNSVSTNASVSDSPVAPSRFYAAGGDIVGLRTGTVVTFHPTEGPRAGQIDYVAAGPVAVKAGRDIVYAGMRSNDAPLEIGEVANSASRAQAHGNLIVHTHQNDVSVIEAGRDILYANFEVAGPGTLEISADRNIVQNDLANLTSIGPVVASDTRPGAGIVVQAGLGAQGANYTGLLKKYLDPANLAASGTPLADQGDKVVKTYGAELATWLSERYGFKGSSEEALAYFNALAPEQQRIFARHVYFAELREGGREYNDADGPRFGSYLRGRNAIAAMFPQRGADGQTIGYQGNLLMYGGSGIHTNLGGDIQVLTPGGAQTYGIEGAAPPSTAGLITRGQGSIELYALGSILLGQSRVMTTFGGDILAWSAEGDINAGRGSKTTVVFTPPRQVYDGVGNMKISPEVPSTGAGIATLAPLPEVPPGDIDLIAPLGTIDAGEAGIRVSGNVNIAALRVVNAENIQVQGKSSGLPVVAAVNVSALSNASAAASSAAAAAQDAMQRERAVARQNLPSIFTVRVLGFGNEAAPPRQEGQEAPAPGAELRSGLEPYDPARMVKIVGLGERIDARYWKRFTDAERQRLQQDR
ncbi:filamentous haemagglutinin family protein [Variovorax sp.]|uniref:filamentous haemagglutinin family protein n=1 Tax=Variovorax sp. TaxID=1871043 RepID=UPI0025FCFAD9|nr:filamentous haemagglutinin family protein [Variovorax sp.]